MFPGGRVLSPPPTSHPFLVHVQNYGGRVPPILLDGCWQSTFTLFFLNLMMTVLQLFSNQVVVIPWRLAFTPGKTRDRLGFALWILKFAFWKNHLTSAKTWCEKKKIVVLNCWIPCWAGPFFDPRATARARWTPPKARSSRFTRPASRSRPHRAVPTSQRHGYQAEDVRLHSLDSNRASGFNSWPLGLTLPGFNYPPRSSAGSSGPRPGLSDSLESASSSRCHVSPPSVPRSRLPRSTRAVRSRAVRPER